MNSSVSNSNNENNNDDDDSGVNDDSSFYDDWVEGNCSNNESSKRKPERFRDDDDDKEDDDIYNEEEDYDEENKDGKRLAIKDSKRGAYNGKYQDQIQQHKNTMVPQRYNEDPKLGKWVHTQRKNYRNDNILPNRLALLNSIYFTWEGAKAARDQMAWMNEHVSKNCRVQGYA
ncbi:hypothetical protein FRACYDRAFT_250275 [Fragilariopsis cylindrus CCMP1102]|uniref:Helicase-associated domain-containing protein n=1 Tax=Fragilariopsis cylindrus CCMP1102 TaxID=635003 RepID=A0A1E7ER89_9STRA|nr:hypothetical protein FRACYDRAFT_250275 [Fragilariopsis cylindrus CCMP1102]|eukprot:OEU08053.1 hypothetical protein FRACYDRAFT_250275 [Fragilariopsis cylindrus CCMP1102]